jgi:hypothetical protein
MARIWQKIEGDGHICHWWQHLDGRKISAMTEILTTAIAIIALLVGFAALVVFSRRDAFAAPGTGYRPSDELGPFDLRRR